MLLGAGAVVGRRGRRWRAALLLAVALAGAACGRGGDGAEDSGDVTGRVMSLTEDQYCVSPDQGSTQTCVDIPDPRSVQGVDVGECVTTSKDLTAPGEGVGVKVVDEAACASGDLGDEAPED